MDFLSMLRNKQPHYRPIEPAKPTRATNGMTPPILNLPQPETAKPILDGGSVAPLNTPPVSQTTEASRTTLEGIADKELAKLKPSGEWKAPLSNAFSAISDLMRAGQAEDFLPPLEMRGIIPRPQPIAYQPIPYQAPILRRY